MTERRGRGIALLVAAAAVIAACAAPGGGPTSAPVGTVAAGGLTLEVRQDGTLGAYVAGKDGMSLYVFTKDTGGASTCTGDCAATWPPLTVGSASDVTAGSGVTGALGTIERGDATTQPTLQVTLGGAPLYYFAADSAAGDTKGQGVGGVWFLASPSGTPVGGTGSDPTGQPGSTTCSGPACY